MSKHALLSASSSHRWINCPPSARLCAEYEDKIGSFAIEGTEAHRLCEYKLKTSLGMDCKDPIEKLHSDEMEECVDGYVAYILELIEIAKQTCPDPQILIEQRLDFTRYVEDGYGTGDCVIIADGTLYIIDYKHGQGVLVEAEDNSQLKLYALGALEIFDGIYDISDVSMTIYQPRKNNISVQTISKESLYEWAEQILKPTAQLAFSGNGKYKCGEWCRFCRAKYECRERASQSIELARYDFRLPPLLDDSEIQEILEKVDDLISWVLDIKNYALKQAINGKQWDNWKLVEGRSNRKYRDEKLVVETAKSAGYDDIYEIKLISVSAMEKLLGKEQFNQILGSLIEKPKGKLTLVPMTDKRPSINDFMEEKQ